LKLNKLIIYFFFFVILNINFSYADKSTEEASIIHLHQVQTILNDADEIIPSNKNKNIYKIYKDKQLYGYAFISSNFAESKGFASSPFNILVCISPQGEILNAILLSHSEPLFLYDNTGPVEGKEEGVLYRFVSQYNNKTINGLSINTDVADETKKIDGVADATITSILMHQSIKLASNKVARIVSIPGFVGNKNTLDHETYKPMTWLELLKDGSIGLAKFIKNNNGKIILQKNEGNMFIDDENRYLENYFSFITKGDKGRIEYKKDYEYKNTDDEQIFLDIYFAYANPVGIGQNIIGKTAYINNFARSGRPSNVKGFFVSTRGSFSVLTPLRCLEHKTSISRKNCETKGLSKNHFDRIYIEQNGKKFSFKTTDRTNFMFTRNIEDSTPRFFNEIALLFIDNPEEFDPAQAWNLVINFASRFSKISKEERQVSLSYIPPSRLIIEPVLEQNLNNNWISVWKLQSNNLFILIFFFFICFLIFFYQTKLVRNRKIFNFLRIGSLVFCLIWVGWIAGAQLTIVNILNYVQLLVTKNFNYSVIAYDPLITAISIATLISFFVVGRGFFCGWLCPFGALQELVNVVARFFRVRQIEIKEKLHKILLNLKYFILLMIFISMFYDLDLALIMTEIEPFKTAITLKFDRSFNYLCYALILLFISIFVNRFYCRYLCPLGAFLVLGGKFRILNILKRRKECGNPCHLCEKSCPTQAIQSSGKIDMNECFYCFDCQEEYYDIHRCPPLVQRKKQLYR
jgi:NosR/NirI family transcriptional regulator, nitrous oxide reductase regulator